MNEKFGALAPTISDTFDTALYKFFICFNKFERHWKTLAKTMSLIISLSEPTVRRHDVITCQRLLIGWSKRTLSLIGLTSHLLCIEKVAKEERSRI